MTQRKPQHLNVDFDCKYSLGLFIATADALLKSFAGTTDPEEVEAFKRWTADRKLAAEALRKLTEDE